MILSATLSKPVGTISDILGNDFTRVKIRRLASSSSRAGEAYFAEFFTEKQVFHKRMTESALGEFIDEHAGKTFRSCVIRSDGKEIQILSNKKGKITRIERDVSAPVMKNVGTQRKNRIIEEGVPVPFFVRLGVMTAEGKVIAAKYDKFRQINRFLEIVDDILPDVMESRARDGDSSPLRVVDFGSGKSYLTFAVHYFLREIKGIDCEVFGLDLKKDVIEYCSRMAAELNLPGLSFSVGDISTYSGSRSPDIVVTLHACDTATDFALDYAVKRGVRAILSVPCCQHEVNAQLSKLSDGCGSPFEPLLRFGLIKERFAALATDAIRAELLERAGYRVQAMEFIDAENTPKNLLLRAVRTGRIPSDGKTGASSLMAALGISQTLEKLLSEK
ncbi:class I SAM-dependent methyltransferase [Treponema saccharophilum]|uniref:class I SAM-dependent methyltransferase n=1 Tax=Treponema saccharophilum TaxID=165 RepID=UPI00386E59C3